MVSLSFLLSLGKSHLFFISLGSWSSQIVIQTQPIRCVWSVIFLGLGVEYDLSFVNSATTVRLHRLSVLLSCVIVCALLRFRYLVKARNSMHKIFYKGCELVMTCEVHVA